MVKPRSPSPRTSVLTYSGVLVFAQERSLEELNRGLLIDMIIITSPSVRGRSVKRSNRSNRGLLLCAVFWFQEWTTYKLTLPHVGGWHIDRDLRQRSFDYLERFSFRVLFLLR